MTINPDPQVMELLQNVQSSVVVLTEWRKIKDKQENHQKVKGASFDEHYRIILVRPRFIDAFRYSKLELLINFYLQFFIYIVYIISYEIVVQRIIIYYDN